ncbi:MAG: carboxylating nicotinate-nucleotide diphosphorylase [Cyclobacteriaceae bacterium]|nr:carboxylating nicotinate-nucleotide diphosphorylase [Cyclobacteriaceae bacterium HetDA_MAG_MS6]
MELPYLSDRSIRKFIKLALEEDLGSGDYSSLGAIPAERKQKAHLIVKDQGIIAGLEMAKRIFKQVSDDLELEFFKEDGDSVSHGDIGFEVAGDARDLLAAERLVLNCLQRMSGIATYTSHLNHLIKGTDVRLLDTRKTTPNFRIAEKWAVAIGGGVNHRFGLYDMIMLKDNHIDYAGGVRAAVERTLQFLQDQQLELQIEVEVRSLQELAEVLEVGNIHRIMLDNMLPSDIREAIMMVDGRYETEASGGITEKTIREIAETGVDYISVGALTHSYTSLDMSLKAI